MKLLWIWYLGGALFVIIIVLLLWRARDVHFDRQAWVLLSEIAASKPAVYTPELVADLPEPATRYFNFTIKSGTSLTSVVELEMTGELGLGNKAKPNYQPMQARQILAPPFGFVWKLDTKGIVGSDGALPDTSWTRFWLFGLFPIVRAHGPDHQRSAFGRVISEAAFWAPASLLPGPYVRWESLDENSARAIVQFENYNQAVDVSVDANGAPTQVLIQRWSNENSDNVFREQPFGGYLSNYQEFSGYRLPTRVAGGNLIGTPDYFPFFKADVIDIQFPELTSE